MDPLMSFHLQLQEEVESYERLKRGELGGELTSLRGLGHALICLRIAADVSQAELAKRLEVDPSQVSRDERNEYHGITIDRAARIIDALGAKLRLRFEIERKEPSGGIGFNRRSSEYESKGQGATARGKWVQAWRGAGNPDQNQGSGDRPSYDAGRGRAARRTKRLVARVWRAIEAEHFYPAPSPMACGGCPCREPCRKWPG